MAEITQTLIRQQRLQKQLNLSRSGLYKLRRNDPSFPQPLKLGSSIQAPVFYVCAEIDAWLEQQCRHRRAD